MTQKVNFNADDVSIEFEVRQQREMSEDDFIKNFGSGTLRKSHKLGMNVRDAYLAERTKFEFGFEFEIIQRSRLTYQNLKLESCQALTELGWYAERMIFLSPFSSDAFQVAYIDVEYSENHKKSGAGIIVKSTSAPWIPNGYIVFAIVTERKYNQYQKALNPF